MSPRFLEHATRLRCCRPRLIADGRGPPHRRGRPNATAACIRKSPTSALVRPDQHAPHTPGVSREEPLLTLDRFRGSAPVRERGQSVGYRWLSHVPRTRHRGRALTSVRYLLIGGCRAGPPKRPFGRPHRLGGKLGDYGSHSVNPSVGARRTIRQTLCQAEMRRPETGQRCCSLSFKPRSPLGGRHHRGPTCWHLPARLPRCQASRTAPRRRHPRIAEHAQQQARSQRA